MENRASSPGGPGGSTTSNKWFVSYLLSNMAAGIIAPLIPLYVVIYLHSNVLYVGLVSSIASASSVPALIFWGNLSDYAGRRKIFILTGFAGSFLTLLQIILVHDITGYVIMLVSFQFLAMAAVPVSTLLILETRQENEWSQVMSVFSMVSAIGTVIGLAAGSLIILFWKYSGALPSMYLLASVIYLAAAVSAYFVLPEPGRQLFRQRLHALFSLRVIERGRHFPSYILHIVPFGRNRGESHAFTAVMRKYLFTTTFLMFGFQIFFVPFPVFLIDKLNASETQIFVLYLLNSSISMLTYRVSGLLVKKRGIRGTLSMGIIPRIVIFTTASILPFLASQGVTILIVSMVLYGILGGLWSFISIGEVTSISKLAIKVNRGKAVGFYNSLLGVGQIGGAMVSGYVAYSLGYSIDFLMAAAIVVIGTVMILRFYPGRKHTSGMQSEKSGANNLY